MAKSPSLEDTFDKLEDILGQMESGELTMNESFKKEMIIINDDNDSEMIDDD